ncbi:DEAD-domain-containing protein [Exidia glandulosa HHB12029]|uniref:ATP-dependent RNA helicase n=1 Tax=Exidia glandulosa HHB12029 TaxID=1314781 RepID=A0A165KPQ5_EXIGL|nr:DEAD-domain-containing protein [Exidia glandulosa HHB12029]
MADAKRSPSPLRALPAFPLPKQPAAPSAEALQRQGVDSALLGATRIDPRQTLDLDAPELAVVSGRTKKRLRDLGIRELFAVQTALVPHLLAPAHRALYLPYDPPRDVCASAPTGSGKTLAYVVPVVEMLATRVVTRLRALIVLPTRDLVTQVREVFDALAKGTGLKAASVTGASSFAHEQGQLVDSHGASKVDVVICTPGRLIDHLDGTPEFTLQHLRFLVIDEADRLLTQSFQDWLARVLSAIAPTSSASRRDVAPAFLPLEPRLHSGPGADPPPRSSCQKLLLSATLTRDPGRLAALGLNRPQYFVVASGTDQSAVVDEVVNAIPEALEEHMVVCEGTDKPLVLSWILRLLLDKEDRPQALVFCKSVEAATRLSVLLSSLLPSASIAAYSSDAPRALLESFRAHKVDVLVCSDLVSRGLDVPAVGAVLNYDAPVDARKYVHRVGRTARAGRGGVAWTTLEPQEARWFKGLVSGMGREGRVKKVRVGDKELASSRVAYEVCRFLPVLCRSSSVR